MYQTMDDVASNLCVCTFYILEIPNLKILALPLSLLGPRPMHPLSMMDDGLLLGTRYGMYIPRFGSLTRLDPMPSHPPLILNKNNREPKIEPK